MADENISPYHECDRTKPFTRRAAFAFPESLRETRSEPKRVAVIGGGIAGLTCAYELLRFGHTVVLYERGDRWGGRIETHRFSDGTYGELGAMRVPHHHGCVNHYVDEFGLPKRDFVSRNDDAFLEFRGALRRRFDWLDIAGLFGVADQPEFLLERLGMSIPRPAGTARWGQFVNDFSDDQLGAMESHSLIQLVEGMMTGAAPLSENEWEFIGGYFGFHWIEDISVLFWSNVGDLLDPKGRYELEGGMGTLADAFVGALRSFETVDLRLNTDVVSIGVVPAGVIIEDVSNRETYDAAICAIPAPAVARIEFSPELPPKQKEAIRSTRYFPAVKALAHCRTRAWETIDGIFGGSSATDRLHQQCWYPSDNAQPVDDENDLAGSGRAIGDEFDGDGFPLVLPTRWTSANRWLAEDHGVFIATYAWGVNAERISAMPEAVRQEELLKSLEVTHPWIRAQLLEPLVVRSWPDQENPGGGAFAYFTPSEQRRYAPWLCRAHAGKVFFAGEHHGIAQGWIQGAIQSGLAAVLGVQHLP